MSIHTDGTHLLILSTARGGAIRAGAPGVVLRTATRVPTTCDGVGDGQSEVKVYGGSWDWKTKENISWHLGQF